MPASRFGLSHEIAWGEARFAASDLAPDADPLGPIADLSWSRLIVSMDVGLFADHALAWDDAAWANGPALFAEGVSEPGLFAEAGELAESTIPDVEPATPAEWPAAGAAVASTGGGESAVDDESGHVANHPAFVAAADNREGGQVADRPVSVAVASNQGELSDAAGGRSHAIHTQAAREADAPSATASSAAASSVPPDKPESEASADVIESAPIVIPAVEGDRASGAAPSPAQVLASPSQSSEPPPSPDAASAAQPSLESGWVDEALPAPDRSTPPAFAALPPAARASMPAEVIQRRAADAPIPTDEGVRPPRVEPAVSTTRADVAASGARLQPVMPSADTPPPVLPVDRTDQHGIAAHAPSASATPSHVHDLQIEAVAPAATVGEQPTTIQPAQSSPAAPVRLMPRPSFIASRPDVNQPAAPSGLDATAKPSATVDDAGERGPVAMAEWRSLYSAPPARDLNFLAAWRSQYLAGEMHAALSPQRAAGPEQSSQTLPGAPEARGAVVPDVLPAATETGSAPMPAPEPSPGTTPVAGEGSSHDVRPVPATAQEPSAEAGDFGVVPDPQIVVARQEPSVTPVAGERVTRPDILRPAPSSSRDAAADAVDFVAARSPRTDAVPPMSVELEIAIPHEPARDTPRAPRSSESGETIQLRSVQAMEPAPAIPRDTAPPQSARETASPSSRMSWDMQPIDAPDIPSAQQIVSHRADGSPVAISRDESQVEAMPLLPSAQGSRPVIPGAAAQHEVPPSQPVLPSRAAPQSGGVPVDRPQLSAGDEIEHDADNAGQQEWILPVGDVRPAQVQSAAKMQMPRFNRPTPHVPRADRPALSESHGAPDAGSRDAVFEEHAPIVVPRADSTTIHRAASLFSAPARDTSLNEGLFGIEALQQFLPDITPSHERAVPARQIDTPLAVPHDIAADRPRVSTTSTASHAAEPRQDGSASQDSALVNKANALVASRDQPAPQAPHLATLAADPFAAVNPFGAADPFAAASPAPAPPSRAARDLPAHPRAPAILPSETNRGPNFERSGKRTADSAPIRISIGRITVDAPASAARPEQFHRPRPTLTLNDYLDRRRKSE
jgi:hypothetical protein